MKQKLFLIVFILALVLSICGCRSIAIEPPKPGYYEGENPKVSFDVVSEYGSNEIQYLILAITSAIDGTVVDYEIGSIPIEPDGTFYKDHNYIETGKINGGIVNGHHRSAGDEPLNDFDWSASWVGTRPAIQLKPGHYIGTFQDNERFKISFDVTTSEIVNFTCEFTTEDNIVKRYTMEKYRATEPIEIDRVGKFSYSSEDTFYVNGKVEGDIFEGWFIVDDWPHVNNLGNGSYTLQYSRLCIKWTAKWVSS